MDNMLVQVVVYIVGAILVALYFAVLCDIHNRVKHNYDKKLEYFKHVMMQYLIQSNVNNSTDTENYTSVKQ